MPLQTGLMKNNYHTHMYLCRHAVGDVEDYVKEAIRLGFKSLGMSDHAPFEELEDRSVRMHPSDLKTYLAQCDACIEKYGSKIKIFKALEIEYFSKHKKMYESLLKKLHYLALGQHYIKDDLAPNNLRSTYALQTKEHITTYADTLIEAMRSKYFKFVCHPDLMLYSVRKFDTFIEEQSRRIINVSIECNMPLEINVNGIRKGLRETEDGMRYLYPRLEFWKLVKELKAKVIVSSDAHLPHHLYNDEVVKAYDFAKQLMIEVEEEI